MFMNGTIMSARVNEFFTIEANVFDQDEEQTYKAEIVGGLVGLEELLKLKKLALKNKGSISEDQLEEAAAQVEMPPTMQPVPLRIRRVKVNKAGFMSLLCDLAQE